ncbi:hypothetical protein GCM10029963_14830 [Micromonospora andamanensis]
MGIRALTRYALVEELLGLAAEDQRLRATLPFGTDVADPDAIEPELTETVEALREWLLRADPAAVATRLRQRAWSASRPAPIRPLAQAAAITALTADTLVMARGGLRWQLVGEGDRVTLRLFDRTISVPAPCEPAVRALLAGPPIRVGDLPGLDTDADRLTLTRRLLREAALTPAQG